MPGPQERPLQDVFAEATQQSPFSSFFEHPSVLPSARTAAIEFFRRLLGSAVEEPQPLPSIIQLPRLMDYYSGLKDQPQKVWTVHNVDSNADFYDDDPHGEMAVALAQRLYPHIAEKITGYNVGYNRLPSDRIAQIRKTLDGTGSVIDMAKSDSLGEALDTIRHEYAHAAGVPDNTSLQIIRGIDKQYFHETPTLQGASDTGLVSRTLNSDIDLAADPNFGGKAAAAAELGRVGNSRTAQLDLNNRRIMEIVPKEYRTPVLPQMRATISPIVRRRFEVSQKRKAKR